MQHLLPPIRKADQKTIAETQEAAAKQQQAIKQFSTTAQALLTDLDKTALQVNDAKREISQTVELFDRQREAAQVAQANLSKLAEEQRDIQNRTEEMERLLQGQKTVTEGYMERSRSLVQNLWSGVVPSLIASFIFAGLVYPGTLFIRWMQRI